MASLGIGTTTNAPSSTVTAQTNAGVSGLVPDYQTFGNSATDEITFYGGTTAVARRASAAQAGVATTSATATTPYGYSQAQADAIVATLNEVVATLTGLNLWKGGA